MPCPARYAPPALHGHEFLVAGVRDRLSTTLVQSLRLTGGREQGAVPKGPLSHRGFLESGAAGVHPLLAGWDLYSGWDSAAAGTEWKSWQVHYRESPQ